MHSIKYIWDNKEMNILGYAITPMLFLWLCGWTCAGISLIQKLLADPISWSKRISWLIGWFVGEAVVISILYFILRPKKPSVLTLSPGYFEYETGTRPFDIISGIKGNQPIKELWALYKGLGNKTYRIKEPEAKMLNLERIGERQKLFFVCEGRRIEIGDSLSEPEREWLYAIMKDLIQRRTNIPI